MGEAKISVCMATYNGAAFLSRQLESVLQQLGEGDELVIVDDASTDGTADLLRELRDPRVKIYANSSNRGHVLTFERAMGLSSNEIILLSDQDDEWADGRVDLFRRALEMNLVVASSFREAEEDGTVIKTVELSNKNRDMRGRDAVGLFLARRPYYGCAMGLRREMLALLLPFPRSVEAHDHWIAVSGSLVGGVGHIADPTLTRTIHGANLTSKERRSLFAILNTRVRMLSMVASAAIRLWGRNGRAPAQRSSRSVYRRSDT